MTDVGDLVVEELAVDAVHELDDPQILIVVRERYAHDRFDVHASEIYGRLDVLESIELEEALGTLRLEHTPDRAISQRMAAACQIDRANPEIGMQFAIARLVDIPDDPAFGAHVVDNRLQTALQRLVER